MGLQKPSASKAPAVVSTIGNSPSVPSLDPCCIPVSVPPLLANASGDSKGGPDATHHIKSPTAH